LQVNLQKFRKPKDLRVLCFPGVDAAEIHEVYDPLTDDNLTLEQITMYIKRKDDEVKLAFKQFCDAPPDSDQKNEL